MSVRSLLATTPPWFRYVAIVVVATVSTAFGWGVILGGHRAALAQAAETAVEASEASKDAQVRLTELEASGREHSVLEQTQIEAIREIKDALEKVNDKLDALAEAISRVEGRLDS